jgi:hypothetical protein
VVRRTLIIGAIILGGLLVLIGVGATQESGPTDEVLASGRTPSTTTTTQPLPEGIFIIRITNASFSPAVQTLDLNQFQVLRWENHDDVPYVIVSRDRDENRDRIFESPEVPPGGTWEFEISTLEPDVHRYFTTRGAQTIPGLVDTRPAQ